MSNAAPIYQVIKKNIEIPIIANIPHSATAIPLDIRQSLLLDNHELEKELVCMTDWYTDELFASINTFGGVTAIFGVSRLVLDPERFLDDAKEVMALKGMGVIYSKTSTGRALRNALPPDEREKLIDQFYRPYHRVLEESVASLLESFGRCLIIDCHSFSSKPLPHEQDQDPDRPDICLGTDTFHTPNVVTEIVEGSFQKHGFTTKRNMPFDGTYVPVKYLHHDARVSSIMVEINRKLYMNEISRSKSQYFLRVTDAIASMTNEITRL